MKKLSAFVLSILFITGAHSLALAEHETMAQGEMVKVFQCPMDGYIVAAKCPYCGMDMEKKEVKIAEYQAAIEKQQAKMKGRA